MPDYTNKSELFSLIREFLDKEGSGAYLRAGSIPASAISVGPGEVIGSGGQYGEAINLAAVIDGLLPVGIEFRYPTPTPPAGASLGGSSVQFALANGAAVSRSEFSRYFSLVGETYGVGDGFSTFNLPNYTDRFPMGAGNMHASGDVGGSSSHDHVVENHDHEIPDHTHDVPDHTHDTEEVSFTANTGNPDDVTSVQSGAGAFVAASIHKHPVDIDVPAGTTEGSGILTTDPAGAGATTMSSPNTDSADHIPPFLAGYWMVRIA